MSTRSNETHSLNKLNVFLDLDNTIISSEPLEDFPFKKKGIKEKVIKFPIHSIDDYYICAERPGAQEFLDWLFEHCNVHVFTAASRDYGLFIIENVILKDSDRQLGLYMFSDHCTLALENYECPKDLRILWEQYELADFTADNCILIDDLKENCEQPTDCINVKGFELLGKNSDRDNELNLIQKKIEQKINSNI